MDLPLLCSRRSRVFFGCVEREFDMRWNAVLASSIVSGLVPAAQGQVAFYLSGNVAGGESAFVSALSSAPTVFGFDSFSNFQPIDQLSDDIDLSLIGPLGEIRSASARVFFSGAFNTPGRVYQGAVLPSTSSASGRIRLDFDVPVEGVGAWHFDDGNTTRNHARLTVIDTLGNSHTSSILDDNSGFGHGIEGFLGAVDCSGIVAAIFESYDTLPLAWTAAHEIDNVHVGRQLAAALPTLSRPCPGASLTLRAHAPGATTFQWRHDGVPIEGATDQFLLFAPIKGEHAGVYDCEIDAGLGSCSGSFTTPARVVVCRADFTCDAAVDDADFVIFVEAYNQLVCSLTPIGCPADLNDDDFVDDSDFVLFVAAYNNLLCS